MNQKIREQLEAECRSARYHHAGSGEEADAYVAGIRRGAEAHAKLTGWKPIETAPKDGTPLLLFTPRSDGKYFWIEQCTFDPDVKPNGGWLSDIDGEHLEDVQKPTHWTPANPPEVST